MFASCALQKCNICGCQADIAWIVAVVAGMMLCCITFSFLCYTVMLPIPQTTNRKPQTSNFQPQTPTQVMTKASYGTLFAAAWIVVWTMLSDTIAGAGAAAAAAAAVSAAGVIIITISTTNPCSPGQITVDNMVFFGWNFVLAFHRAAVLMCAGVRNP